VPTCIGVGGCGGEECHPVGVVGDDLADTAPENARIKMFALRTSRRWVSTTSSPCAGLA
jgi:hypothetical protein